MRLQLLWLPLACLLPLLVGVAELHAAAPPASTPVRALLNAKEFKEARQQLIRMGESAFPTYDVILADPRAYDHVVARVFEVLREVKADRRRFRNHALRHLAAWTLDVRYSAIRLLEVIGTPAEASPLVALLSDSEKVARAAAEALAAIGGRREVTALDVWLQGISHSDNVALRRHVKQCRDKLKKRLDQADRATKR